MIGQISAVEIDAWAKADPRKAQEVLPSLMIRLILATSKKIGDFNFPIEKGIQFTGYDGVLESNESTNFFPTGKSVWEFGTNNDAINKFRGDIKKRSTESLGVNINETTFIFATLKIWNHRTSIEELINESKQKYNWKDIRIIDASKIALWLESCPSVSIWMCETIGKTIKGLLSVEQYWEDHCLTTKPILVEDFFLYGRGEQLDSLSDWISNECEHNYRLLMAESSLEATLFIVASLMALSDSDNNALRGVKNRVVIVTLIEAWHEIISNSNFTDGVIFIPTFNFTEEIRCPKNISAILPISKYSSSAKISKNIPKIEITVRTRDELSQAFELLGYTTSEAYDIGTKTKRNFLSFYRMVTNLPNKKLPKWTIQDNLQELIPALLLGGWNDKYLGDKEIIEKISGISYEEYIKKLSKWILIEDAPLFSILGSYQIVSIQDCWGFLFDKLTPIDINNLKSCMKEIFGSTDPAFELPENQRFMASVLGKESKYSTSLRHGLVITLIMLVERESEVNSFGINSTVDFVYGLIRDILSEMKSPEQLSTIAPSLPLLAEAAPKAVLEKLELEIENEDSNIWKLFVPSEDFITGRNYYTHILWTLEILVWHSSLVVRAILVLARICEKNLDYKMVNSPQNTLYGIFCTWHPQSALSKDERLELLRKICNSYPITGQMLLKSLLPTGHPVCGQIQRPRWSVLDVDLSSSATVDECREVTDEIIKLSLNTLSNDVEQWKTVFDHISLYEYYFEELKSKCLNCCKSLSEEDAYIVASFLREQIHRFRKFRDADWSISEEYVFKLEQLFNEIEPNTIMKYNYLFVWHPNLLNPVPYNRNEKSDYEAERKALFYLRSDAVDEIINLYGTDAFISFCSELEDTSDLAKIITEKIFKNVFDLDMLAKIKEHNYTIYASVIWRLTDLNGLDVLISILTNTESCLSEEEKGDILCHTPVSSELWKILDKSFSEVATNYYWQHVKEHRLNVGSTDNVDYYISKLLEFNRPFSAVKTISYSDYGNVEMIISILQQLLHLQEHKEASGLSFSSIDQSNILDLFDKLYENQNIDDSIVARLEIAYLPYFRYEGNPKCLIKYLQTNPKEFVLFISKCYKPDEISDELIIDEEYRSQANIAHDVLNLFKTVPGCNKSIISADVFSSWISEAYQYASMLGVKNSFEACLGKLLSHSPVGSDGIFPHEIIRDFLEKNDSSSLVNSFIMEKQNQRGIYTVTGGIAEKKIANGYYEESKKVRVAYPKTSAILERLGDIYKREAQFEQKQELLDFTE